MLHSSTTPRCQGKLSGLQKGVSQHNLWYAASFFHTDDPYSSVALGCFVPSFDQHSDCWWAQWVSPTEIPFQRGPNAPLSSLSGVLPFCPASCLTAMITNFVASWARSRFLLIEASTTSHILLYLPFMNIKSHIGPKQWERGPQCILLPNPSRKGGEANVDKGSWAEVKILGDRGLAAAVVSLHLILS